MRHEPPVILQLGKYEGFPARVDGKIDQEAAMLIWPVIRDSHDPRTKNAKSKAVLSGGRTVE
jgi:hypothetical protein